jgi:hypothetical protein
MARSKDNPLIKGMEGAIGKDIVFRTINGKTYSGKYPDMSGIIPSKNQTKGRERFAEAVKFAQAVRKNPEKYPEIKAGKGETLYHAAIKAFLNLYRPDPAILLSKPDRIKDSLVALSLTEAQLRATAYICAHQKISNLIYRQINDVSKPTATRHLQELAEHQIIKSNGGKGAGAFYLMGSFFEEIGSDLDITGQ